MMTRYLFPILLASLTAGCDLVTPQHPLVQGTPDLQVDITKPENIRAGLCTIETIAKQEEALFSYWWNQFDGDDDFSALISNESEGYQIAIAGMEGGMWFLRFHELNDYSRPMSEVESISDRYLTALSAKEFDGDCGIEPSVHSRD